MGSGLEAEEELEAVWVSVDHGEDTSTNVLVNKVLVVKSVTIDGLVSCSVTSREVSSLCNEVGDDAIELASFKVKVLSRLAYALLSSAETSEVLSCLGAINSVEVNDYSADGLATNGHVEENLGRCLVLQTNF